MFCEVVSSNVADIAPVDLAEAILALSAAGGARYLSVRFKNVINVFSYDAKVAICDDFIRVVTKFANEFLDSSLDGGRFEILETEEEFAARGTINEEKSIIDASNGTSISVNDVIVEDLSVYVGAFY